MDLATLLDRLIVYGKVAYPSISDLERVLGPLFVDIDSSSESTHGIFRPEATEEPRPFWYVELLTGAGAGNAVRVCAHAPVTIGRSEHVRLPLEAANASRRAAEVKLVSEMPTLIPYAEASPPVIAGREIAQPRTLEAIEEISFGDDRVRIGRHPGWRTEFSPLVRFLSASFEWDMFHELPNRDRDRSIKSFMLIVNGSAEEVERVLAPAFGGARTMRDGGRAMHPFYVEDKPAGVVIEWSKEVPEKALRAVDPKARKSAITRLFRALPELTTLALVETYVKTIADDAGITEAKPLNADDVWIRLRPPMDAREILAIAGWLDATAETHDVHMSSWSIYVHRKTPRVGPWCVDVRLDRWPKRVDGAEREAASEYDLVEHTSPVEWIVVRHPRDYD